MKSLRNILLTCFVGLMVLFFIIIEAYFIKFSGGISDKTDDWLLFITICNWGFISLLTGLNVWVFFKLTSLMANNEKQRHIENKISRSEDAILRLRINDYKLLREQAVNLKLAILKGKDFNYEFRIFMKILISMQNSHLFATIDNKESVLDEPVKYITDAFKSDGFNAEKIICQIDSVLRTIEILIFSQQLRDDRIINEIRKFPNRFDVTLIGIDNYVKNIKL